MIKTGFPESRHPPPHPPTPVSGAASQVGRTAVHFDDDCGGGVSLLLDLFVAIAITHLVIFHYIFIV